MVLYRKKILNNFGFSNIVTNWIMQCISTPSFSVLINGSPQGFFQASQGLPQGDPLSPYLFILSMEILSRMFHIVEQMNYIKGIKISRNNMPISHLLFADDLMILSRATPSDANNCKIILVVFNSWGGLEINYHKSGIFFSKYVKRGKKERNKRNS